MRFGERKNNQSIWHRFYSVGQRTGGNRYRNTRDYRFPIALTEEQKAQLATEYPVRRNQEVGFVALLSDYGGGYTLDDDVRLEVRNKSRSGPGSADIVGFCSDEQSPLQRTQLRELAETLRAN